jgi:hypothetical protein
MSRTPLEPLSAEITALLASERSIEPEPEAVRRRALLRARAAARWQNGKPGPSAGRWGFWGRIPPVAAAAAICLVITALSAAVLRASKRMAQPAASPRQPEPACAPLPSATGTHHPSEATSAQVESEPQTKTEVVGAARPASREEGYARELRLLQPARQAVSAGSFASALSSIAAHERRFPNGRLAEEREALRVKALRGLGRADDARRAAAEFRRQFPRSVLSSQMGEAPPAAP